MPTAYKTDAMNRNQPMPTSSGSLVVVYPFTFNLSAALVAADTITVAKVPAGHVPVDFLLDSDDLDSNGTPTITMSAGITGATTCFLNGSTVGQAGGVARADQKAGFRVAPTDADRDVLLTVGTGPATGATTGVISGWIAYRPALSRE